MRWARRNQFAVGRTFFGWAIENGTVYTVGGRVNASACECTSDIRATEADRIILGTASKCRRPPSCTSSPEAADQSWQTIGCLPSPLCVCAHSVVLFPVTPNEQP